MSADAETLEAFANRKVTSALILAACSFFLCPLVAALGAVVVAHQAQRLYREHPELTRNGGLPIAIALSWAGVAFGIAAVIYVFVN